jgi:hypothetical protein
VAVIQASPGMNKEDVPKRETKSALYGTT